MNPRLLLPTGATFSATDRLLRTYRYRLIGLDLSDLSDGIGCRYIVLYNLDTNVETCVEAQWFSERNIHSITYGPELIEPPELRSNQR